MRLNALLAILMLALAPTPAAAQALFSNPFSDAATYRSQRSAPSEARYRVRYEVTREADGAAPVASELVLDIADDWALAREGERVRLHDFRLNRVFTLSADSFTGMNIMGDLVFRVMERQNRSYLQRLLDTAGAQGQLPDACDADSELSLVIPGAADAGVTEWSERRSAFSLRCANREIGGFTAGDGAVPPPAFWPAMYAEMPTHPALHRRVRENGRAPSQLNISYRGGTGTPSSRSWRLIAVETISTPYPLETNLRNATAEVLDQLVPGAGRTGAEAVAGRALGGAPTAQSWDAHLRDVSRRDGEAAAAMLLNASFNMFPELQCTGPSQHAACELVSRVRMMQDPAPWAVIEVGAAEQRAVNADAIAAMQRAQTSPLRDHPALGAAFALAILRFNDNDVAQARAANLPLEVAALQNRALLALPYNPAYWTDVGDRFGRNYEWPSAFLFYDVAYSLPMPSAVANNAALSGKRTQMERIRRDFPDAFLSPTP